MKGLVLQHIQQDLLQGQDKLGGGELVTILAFSPDAVSGKAQHRAWIVLLSVPGDIDRAHFVGISIIDRKDGAVLIDDAPSLV